MPRELVCLSILAATACSSRSELPQLTNSEAPAPSRIEPTSVDPSAAPGALAPNLHGARDVILATWLEPGDAGVHRLRFARLEHEAWSAPVTIREATSIVANWADVPSVASGGDGALVAHWAETSGSEPYAYDAIVARSTDGGSTWAPLGALHDDRTPTEHGFVSLIGEPDGVRAFWLDGRATAKEGGAMTLRTARVGDAIRDGAVVDVSVCDCCGTSAATTDAGPIVAYRDRTTDEVRDIHAARQIGDTWTASEAVHRDGWVIAGCPVNGPAIAARGRRVAAAWYTYAGSVHRVRLAFSDDGGATFGAPVEVDGPRGGRAPVGRVGVVLDDDGGAVVSWLASDREDAAVLVRRVEPGGALGAEVRMASSLPGRDAGFPRIARTGTEIVVAWTEPGKPSRLRAARLRLAELRRAGTAPPSSTDGDNGAVAVGSVAPDLRLTSLDGSAVSLASLRGKIVLVNLWATWCEPCRHELPVLAALHEREAADELAIVAINIDRARTSDEIADFVAKRKLPFAVWLDPDDRATAAFGASSFPINVLIDRDGVIRWRRDGAIRADDAELRTALDAALGAVAR